MRTRDDVRAWAGLAVMALVCFALAADVTVLFVAVPAMIADLAPSAAQSLGILHIAEFTGAALVITFGKLTGRLGRRRLLLAGAAVFGLASLLAAWSSSPEMLIVARVLLGLAAAAYTPAALSLLRRMFTEPRRFATALALLLSTFVGGAAASPLLAGALLEHFWWGSVFVVNAVPAAVLLMSAPWLVARDVADPTERVDLRSVVLSVIMVVLIVYGLQTLIDSGPGPVVVGALLGGLALVLVFLRRQRRLPEPLLDLAPFADRRFATAIVVLGGTIFWLNAATMVLAQHLQLARGLTPLQTGATLAVPAVAGIVGTLAGPTLQRLATPPRLLAVALAVAAGAGAAVVALLGHDDLGPLVVCLSILAMTGALAMALSSQLIVTGVRADRTGSASAVQDLVAGTSTAGGIALLGSLAHGVYRAGLDTTTVAGVAPGELAAAAEHPGAGTSVAAGPSGARSDGFADAVADAIAQSTQSVYAVAVLISVVLTVVVLIRLVRSSAGRRRAALDGVDAAPYDLERTYQ